MIEVIGVDVMWFGPWCLYTILITLLVLFNHNDKRGKGMDNPTIVSEDKAEKESLHFYREYRARGILKADENVILRQLTANIDDDRTLCLSYFLDGSMMVFCWRDNPVYVHSGVSLDRPSRQGKRKAIDYVIRVTNEALQYSDINEELGI
jgi:hypothetical protein